MSKLLFSELYVLHWISDLNFQLSTQLLLHSTSHYPPFFHFPLFFPPIIQERALRVDQKRRPA